MWRQDVMRVLLGEWRSIEYGERAIKKSARCGREGEGVRKVTKGYYLDMARMLKRNGV